MMTKIKSNNTSLLKYIIALPLLCTALVFFSCQEQSDLDDNLISANQTSVKMNAVDTGDNDPGDVFKVVEFMPRFSGCEGEGTEETKKDCASQKMLEFIYKNITYPKEARDAGVEGMAVASFIVNKEGNLQDIKLVREIGFGTNEEVLRIIGEMPKWIPGKQNGQKVKVRYHLPIRFKLQ